MKKIQISGRTINYMVGLLLALFVAFIWMMMQTSANPDSETSSYHFKTLSPIDPQVSDSLPHYEYKRLKKEIEYARGMKNGRAENGISYGFTGFTVQKRCETCANSYRSFNVGAIKEYLIRLNWWQLDTGSYEEPVVYYVKNGQSILRKTTCKPAKEKVFKNTLEYSCMETDILVPFRYDQTTHGIMVPVSRTAMEVFEIFFKLFSWGTALVCWYMVLTAFAKILMDIRDGDPFSVGNVKRFKWLAIFCFAAPTVLFLLNLLMWLIFHRYFTADIKLSSEAWLIFWKPLVLGLIFAALYSAFKRGKQLKEEQDLTI